MELILSEREKEGRRRRNSSERIGAEKSINIFLKFLKIKFYKCV
jgi:hypothetical protein